ncbi:hypothetical protein OKA04_15330 [Luteolibacter flavescens]|uniref:Uncharacterized protein n=1 Tax=Luteolibacter flavescens TaxID=1859460 RepID=A0ABT3FR93_9BACT|nr:hypothetical protein [Luteolibacter flavescens]MCW1886110.1 hypothetical protein [Luteolibacter flavescens]
MKAILYVLAILAIGGAGYFSLNAKTKFEDQRAKKEEKALAKEAKTKEGDAKDVELRDELALLDTATKKETDLSASVENLKAIERKLVADTKKVDGTLAEQKETFAKLEGIRAKADEILQGAGVTLQELPTKVAEIEEDKKAKTKALGEVQSLVEAAQKNVESNQAEIARLADRSAARNSRMRQNAMESVVTAVNDDWGFIVIGAGSSTGFKPETKLLVKREGRLIAEVQPSAIEPSQTIAEIDRETVAAGARIQPGDRVILANPATN